MPTERLPQRLSGDTGYGHQLRLFSQYNKKVPDNMSKLIVRYKKIESSRREGGIVIIDHSIITDAYVVNDFQSYIHFMWEYDKVERQPDGVRKRSVTTHIEDYKTHFLYKGITFTKSDEFKKKKTIVGR